MTWGDVVALAALAIMLTVPPVVVIYFVQRDRYTR